MLLPVLIAATGSVSLAEVPTSTGTACPLLEGAAAYLGTQRSVWVERSAHPELLEQARTWARQEPDGGWGRMQQWLETTHDVSFTLPLRAWASPADGALAAACRGDPDLWRQVGAALTPALLMAARSGPERPRGPLARWVDAAVRLRVGERPGPSALAAIASDLDDEDLPTWARPPSELSPTLAGISDELVILFERGVFVALEVETGRQRWTLDGSVAAPSVTWLQGRPLFNTVRGLVQVDPKDGAAMSFFDVERPYEEVAVSPYGLFIANDEEIWAIEPRSGRVLWRRTLSEPITSGPVVSGLHVVVPHRTHLSLLRIDTGRTERTVELADEVSAPLSTTSPDWTWAFVGTRGLMALRLPDTRIVHRTPPLQWPTVSAGSSLFALSGSGRRAELWRIEPSQGPQRLDRGELDLLTGLDPVSVVHVDGDSLVARGADGGRSWRLPLSARPQALAASADILWAAVGETVVRVDHGSGKKLGAVRVDVPTRELGGRATFGVAIGRNGAVYGLPRISDPRSSALHRFATWMRARSLIQARSNRAAASMLEDLLQRFPEDRVAQVLRARARGEAGDWVQVAMWAPDGSRLQAEVDTELQSRGIFRVEPDDGEATGAPGSGPWSGPAARVGADFVELPDGTRLTLSSPLVRSLSLPPVPVGSGAALASGRRVDLLRSDGSVRVGVTLPAEVEQMVALPDEKVGVRLADGTVRIVDPLRRRTGSPLRVPARSMVASPDGTLRLIVDGLVLKWDPTD